LAAFSGEKYFPHSQAAMAKCALVPLGDTPIRSDPSQATGRMYASFSPLELRTSLQAVAISSTLHGIWKPRMFALL